jgi:uncharacterized delta-60 repeat protein
MIVKLIRLLLLLALSPAVLAAPAGQLDTKFGGAGTGIRTVAFNELGGSKDDQATALVKLPDGRIYLIGTVNVGQNQHRIGLTRLSADGIVDNTFGVGGRLSINHSQTKSIYILDAAYQPSTTGDGFIIVVGGAERIGGGSPELIACRLRLDGEFDEYFGDGQTKGCRLMQIASDTLARSVVIQPDGMVVMAGRTFVDGLDTGIVVRLTRNGDPNADLSFDGVVMPFQHLSKSHGFNDVALSPDGRIVVIGSMATAPGNQDFLVGRLKSNGTADTAFNGKGYATVKFDPVANGMDVAQSVSVLPNGAVLAAGYVQTTAAGQFRPAVARLDVAGMPDLNWNAAGKRVYDPCAFVLGGCDMRAFDIAQLPQGKLAVAGRYGPPGALDQSSVFAMRLDENSEPDAAFGSQQFGQTGTIIVPVAAGEESASRILVQGERIVLAGTAVAAAATAGDYFILRLDHGLVQQFSVTPVKIGNGTINPGGVQAVTHSNHVKFVLTPAANHTIASVTGCDGGLAGNVYTTGPVTKNCNVVATFKQDVTLTYAAGPNGVIEGPNPQVIPYGADGAQVKAVANYGYKLDHWSDGKGGIFRTDLDVTENLAVTAFFEPFPWKFQGFPQTSGGGVDPIATAVPHGESGFITIQPDPGYGLASIDHCADGNLVGNAYVVGSISQNCFFNVSFEPSDAKYDLEYSADLYCHLVGQTSQTVSSGYSGSTVTAVAEDGYQFLQWSDGNKDASRTDTHVFDHLKVTAQCAPIDAQLFVVKSVFGKGGALSPFVDQLVAQDQSVAFQVLPAPGYGIGTVKGCGAGELVGNVYTTAPITADCEVEATFVPSNAMYSLEYAVGAGGSQLQGDPDQAVLSGGSGTAVTAVPLPGRFFVQWSDGRTDNPRQDNNVVANVDVTAYFAEEGDLLVTPKAGIGGTIEPHLIQVVKPNGVIEFTVTPKVGFGIVQVSGCGGVLTGKQYTTAPVKEDCLVQATFAPTDAEYLLKYTAGTNGQIVSGNFNGAVFETVVPSGGTGPEVTAMPDAGYLFLTWSDGSTQNPRTDISVIEAVDVTATFVKPTDLVVTPVVVGGVGGAIEPNLAQAVAEGTVLAFTLKPDPGFVIGSVDGCSGELAGNVYTTAPIEASCSVEVTFTASAQTFTLTYSADPAKGAVNGQSVFVAQNIIAGGAGPAVEAKPKPGFFFVQWDDGSQENPRTDANVVGDMNVEALFALNGSLVVTPVVAGNVGGTLQPSLAQVVQPGDVVEFIIKPAPGFAVEAIEGCGGVREGNVFTTAPVEANCQVTVSFTPSDEMFTLSYAAGPNGTIDGMAKVEQDVIAGGTGPMVTAIPDPGYFFVKWSDFPAALGAKRVDENVVGDIAVTATFAPEGTPTHIVTATAGENGGISPEGEQLAVDGESLVFKIEPDPGSIIDNVEGCEGNLVGNLYQTAPVTADCEVHATFAPANGQQFSVTYSAGNGGKVNGQAQVQQVVPAGGDGPAVAAVSNPGFFFVQWSDGIDQNPRTDTHVAADIDVTAIFAANGTVIHTVTPSSGLGGALSPLLPLKVPQGQSAKFEVLPQPGYAVFEIGGSCGGILVGNVYTTDPVTASCTVEAIFAPSDEIFSLSYVAGPDGLVNGAASVQENVLAGEAGPLVEAQPAPGFVFVQWSDGLTDNPRQDTNVAADIDVTAQFAAATLFTLTYHAGANGKVNGQVMVQFDDVPEGGSGGAVQATADAGFFFVQWSDGSTENPRTDANVSADIEVSAQFAAEGQLVVTPTWGAGGSIDPHIAQVVQPGDVVLFTVQPDLGSIIDNVEGCEGNLVGNLYQTAPVTADCEVVATFAPANGQQFSVTYSAGNGGKVNGQAQVQQVVPAGGDGPAVAAVSNPGFFFVQWSDGIDQNPRTDTHVAADIDVTAIFAANGTVIHTVTPSSGLGGALSPLLPLKVPQGQSAKFEVLPQPGYAVFEIGGSCGGILVGNVYTTDPVTASCTVEAIFAPSDEIFSLSYVAGPDGLVNGAASVQENVLAGEAGPLVEAQPAPGFVFVQWSDGLTDNPRQDTNVAADIDVTAQFAPEAAMTFTVTPVAGPGGGWSPAGPQQIEEGQTAEFIVVPNEGHVVDTIGGTCGGSLQGNVYTTGPVTADCTVEVTFLDDRIFANDFEHP